MCDPKMPVAGKTPVGESPEKLNRKKGGNENMKRRFWAGLLFFVMLWSLLPASALAADIPSEYRPTIEWGKMGSEHTIDVTLFYENVEQGTIQSKGSGTTPKVTVPSGIEVYESETSSRCTYALNIFLSGIGLIRAAS